jgi:hypothetical protein
MSKLSIFNNDDDDDAPPLPAVSHFKGVKSNSGPAVASGFNQPPGKSLFAHIRDILITNTGDATGVFIAPLTIYVSIYHICRSHLLLFALTKALPPPSLIINLLNI